MAKLKKRGPGRPPRRRDPVATRKMLERAVGEIMREKGYTGLGVNKVSHRAGVSKKMIYWHYKDFNTLLKTYISTKDFWTPVFRKMGKVKSPDQDTVMNYLSQIFREQFEYFRTEKEMQQFIHWQISVSSTLLKEVSEEREFKGAPFALLTDPYFEGTDISFRSVLAIVLGGIYYTVWHADKNGSSVCGIDINKEKDRIAFEKTIGQVITWAFRIADMERPPEPRRRP